MHFIQQGVDDFYVTVYDADGEECAGYEKRTIRLRRVVCLANYTRGMIEDNFILRCDNMTFNVIHERVKPFKDKVLTMNGLTGDGWAKFGETARIELGQRIVFTNLLNYNVSVVLIGGNGLGLTREDIHYTIMRMFGQRKPLYRDEKAYKRMQQFCQWPLYAYHVNEEHVFYTSLCAYVTDAFKLTIPDDFCDDHLDMHTYTKAYVIHMEGAWRQFGKERGFVEPKMMRVKLMGIVNDNVCGVEIQVFVLAKEVLRLCYN
uniref:Uncharacterized protein n=1 Tax=Tanacetum cinerariifolium TaxID=118510 RepID=A0A6L2NL10_TANCI|nr:hypothetical protein [Tanacetum cinerariifolium]